MNGQMLWDVLVIGAVLGAVYYLNQKEKNAKERRDSGNPLSRERSWLAGSPAVDLWLRGEDAKRPAGGMYLN